MALEPVAPPPKPKPLKYNSSNEDYTVRRSMPPREWIISELIDLYFELDGSSAAIIKERIGVLKTLLSLQGDEDDDSAALFIPDVSDILSINEHLEMIRVDSLVLEAMDNADDSDSENEDAVA